MKQHFYLFLNINQLRKKTKYHNLLFWKDYNLIIVIIIIETKIIKNEATISELGLAEFPFLPRPNPLRTGPIPKYSEPEKTIFFE